WALAKFHRQPTRWLLSEAILQTRCSFGYPTSGPSAGSLLPSLPAAFAETGAWWGTTELFLLLIPTANRARQRAEPTPFCPELPPGALPLYRPCRPDRADRAAPRGRQNRAERVRGSRGGHPAGAGSTLDAALLFASYRR